MGIRAVPDNATSCPSCNGSWGYEACDLCYDKRVGDWADRVEETAEIVAIKVCKTVHCIECGARFLRP